MTLLLPEVASFAWGVVPIVSLEWVLRDIPPSDGAARCIILYTFGVE